jgi:hypothetical protein
MSGFQELKKINVNDKIEKKNGLSYLSWAWAVDQLLTHDPQATWEYQEPKKFGETLMVFCTVTAFGKSMTAQLPVMDFRNKAIANPDAFAVNTAMQRCLAKAISLHGIGLYIYAGEDLPEDDNGKDEEKPELPKLKSVTIDDFDGEEQKFLRDTAIEIESFVSDGDHLSAFNLTVNLDNDEKLALWGLLDSKCRASLKKSATTQLKAA